MICVSKEVLVRTRATQNCANIKIIRSQHIQIAFWCDSSSNVLITRGDGFEPRIKRSSSTSLNSSTAYATKQEIQLEMHKLIIGKLEVMLQHKVRQIFLPPTIQDFCHHYLVQKETD